MYQVWWGNTPNSCLLNNDTSHYIVSLKPDQVDSNGGCGGGSGLIKIFLSLIDCQAGKSSQLITAPPAPTSSLAPPPLPGSDQWEPRSGGRLTNLDKSNKTKAALLTWHYYHHIPSQSRPASSSIQLSREAGSRTAGLLVITTPGNIIHSLSVKPFNSLSLWSVAGNKTKPTCCFVRNTGVAGLSVGTLSKSRQSQSREQRAHQAAVRRENQLYNSALKA